MVKSYINFLVVLFGVLGLFTACKKKAPGTNCYAIYSYDSIWSNKDSLRQKYVQSGPIELCGFTSSMMDVYIKQHSPKVDTLINTDNIFEVSYFYETSQIW